MKAGSKACPICNSKAGLESVLSFYQPVIKKNVTLRVYECTGARCRHSFQHGFSSRNINAYYNKMNRFTNAYDALNEKYLDERWKFIAFNVPTKRFDSFLEIGPYNDGFLKRVSAQKKFFNEKNLESRKKLSEKYKYFDLQKKSSQKFDLIVLCHVLEHVTNPRHFLKILHSKLTNDGYFMVEVPDHSFFFDKRIDPPFFEHLQFFNVKSLALLIERLGFQLIAMQRSLNKHNFTCQNWVTRIIAQKKSSNTKNLHAYWAEELSEYVSMLKKTLKKSEKIILWGISERLYIIFSYLSDKELKKIILVDGKKREAFYKNQRIYNPRNCPQKKVSHLFITTDAITAVKGDMKKYGFSAKRVIPFFNLD